ncbi:MAG: ROK family transcriptional regulator [Actinobacteria bacterium]|nr:ROK family transcriptional regulator [Actinomycetota bacterium]
MKISKPELIRKINRKLVLDVIRKNPLCTKSYISKKLGCSRQTVSIIVSNLNDEGLVLKNGIGESTKEGGKKPALVEFNPKAGYIIGSMLGRSSIGAILTDLNANIIVEKAIPNSIESGHKAIISNMVKLFEEIIKESEIEKKKLLGVGIGVQGIVSPNDGIVVALPHYPDWINIPLVNIIKDELGCEVFIDNENRMRGYGEKWFGLAVNTDDFLTIYAKEGLGAGVFINGKCVMGRNFLSGEIGHIRLDADGPDCVCGNKGCFESLVNVARIRQIFNEKSGLDEFRDSLLVKKFKDNNLEIMIEELFDYFYKGDNLAKLIVDEISYWFGIGISVISSVIDPGLIIIHGPYSFGGDYFKKKVIENAEKNFLLNISKEVNIVYSKLEKKAVLIGSASIVLEKVL